MIICIVSKSSTKKVGFCSVSFTLFAFFIISPSAPIVRYSVEYAIEAKDFEESISTKGITIFIDPAAVMFLVGSEMDWNESKFSSGFEFKNPNETARCGCGESFSVSPSA